MTSLHIIPTHRPWWSRAWIALQIDWLTYRRQCVIDELSGYLSAQMPLGAQYLENCQNQINGYTARIVRLRGVL